jgi:transcriptional regulator with XRE-family HTH domain
MREENFGAFLREYREKVGYGLRTFAEAIGKSPATISAIELGNRVNQFSRSDLENIAECLGICNGSEDWYRLFDLAQAKSLPADVRFEEQQPYVQRFVVGLMRTVDRQQPTEEKLKEIQEYINQQLRLRTE